MEWWMILLAFVPSLIVVMFTGMPIAIGFFAINLVAMSMFMGGEQGLNQLVLSIYDSLAKFSLAPIPLFIFMGEILFQTKIAKRIIDVLDNWLGSLPGRLSILSIFAGMIFGALSGSNMANTALLGSVLGPEMKEKGYHKSMIAGPILASGGLAMMIPPSSLMVVYASIAKLSVAKMLIAGLLPGILMGINYILYTVIRCKLNPTLAPKYYREKKSSKEKLDDFVRILLPAGLLIFMVTGSIFVGVATPTEAAGLGSLGAILIAISYKEFNIKVFLKSTRETVKITAMIFIIIAGAAAFSQFLGFSGATRGLVNFALGLDISPFALMIAMLAIVVFLGCIMDQIPIIMICAPLFLPIIIELNFDPIWFSILFIIALEIGLTTPPFGVNIFVMKGVMDSETTVVDLYKAGFPYVLCDVCSMIIIMLIPAIAVGLPNLL